MADSSNALAEDNVDAADARHCENNAAEWYDATRRDADSLDLVYGRSCVCVCVCRERERERERDVGWKNPALRIIIEMAGKLCREIIKEN